MTDSTPSPERPNPLSRADALGSALRDALDHVDARGWDQPPEIFALVPTAVLAAEHPQLVDPADRSALSVIAQEPLPVASGEEPHAALEEFLATAAWPPVVEGAAVVLDIVVLPPDARSSLDAASGPLTDPDVAASAAVTAARTHPDARTARLAVGVLRDGTRLSLMYLRPGPDDDPDAPKELLTHPELATALQEGLARTFDSL
ncbi:MAG: PPA1309 family protein [Gordonia sp. (in: high G+C Gram-positive bacteria)]